MKVKYRSVLYKTVLFLAILSGFFIRKYPIGDIAFFVLMTTFLSAVSFDKGYRESRKHELIGMPAWTTITLLLLLWATAIIFYLI